MTTIGLIAAMGSESQALLKIIKSYKHLRLGRFAGAAFRIQERECILLTSGMGIRNAAEAARLLIETHHPSCLFSFGIAGAVRDGLQIGDVVMAVQNSTLENGALVDGLPLTELSSASWSAVRQALSLDHIQTFKGTAITTRGSQVLLQNDDLPCPILEMETAGLLQVARPAQIPLIVLRAISDNPSAPLPLDLAAVMDENSRLLPGKLLKELVRHPGLLLKSRQMLRNSAIAAEHAALAVKVTLGQPAFFEMES